jgi:Protein of unknown function (DUF2589)
MADNPVVPAAEFQALPLDFVIASPLISAVKAQAVAAAATRDFINAFKNPKDDTPESVSFVFSYLDGTDKKTANISAPLLSIIPVPHLRIDSLTVHFLYEVTQTTRETASTDKAVDLSAGTTGILSKFVQASFKGSISSRSANESTMNRSGQLEITVHASEAPIPEGLSRLLSLLASAIPAPSAKIDK